jgi:sulfate adenylyltransferase subunit 1
VPVSALKGDNVVHRAEGPSSAMPWYEGPSLLELAGGVARGKHGRTAQAFRFPVQRVLRPDHTFRGFAGQIASGVVRVGDRITVFPSGREARRSSAL